MTIPGYQPVPRPKLRYRLAGRWQWWRFTRRLECVDTDSLRPGDLIVEWVGDLWPMRVVNLGTPNPTGYPYLNVTGTLPDGRTLRRSVGTTTLRHRHPERSHP